MAASVVMAGAMAVSAWRSVLIVQENTLYQRGLFGWRREPVLLDQVTAKVRWHLTSFPHRELWLTGPGVWETYSARWWADFRRLRKMVGA